MQRDPFRKTLTRSTIAAVVLSLALLAVLPRHASLGSDFVDVFTVAFCFTFLGHYVEAALGTVPGIEKGPGQLVHLVGWFAGGLWCYVVARWLWVRYGRDLNDLPGLGWGGVFLIVLQLVMQIISSKPQGNGLR
jgi:hypothetical protein